MEAIQIILYVSIVILSFLLGRYISLKREKSILIDYYEDIKSSHRNGIRLLANIIQENNESGSRVNLDEMVILAFELLEEIERED